MHDIRPPHLPSFANRGEPFHRIIVNTNVGTKLEKCPVEAETCIRITARGVPVRTSMRVEQQFPQH
jgi:hypothetical protein